MSACERRARIHFIILFLINPMKSRILKRKRRAELCDFDPKFAFPTDGTRGRGLWRGLHRGVAPAETDASLGTARWTLRFACTQHQQQRQRPRCSDIHQGDHRTSFGEEGKALVAMRSSNERAKCLLLRIKLNTHEIEFISLRN